MLFRSVYYFTNNQSEEIKPINEKELDELTKDSEDSKKKIEIAKRKIYPLRN